MDYSLKFFKQDGRWYADVPSHSLEDNEMVLGADDFLEAVAEGHKEVTLLFSDEIPSNGSYLYGLKQYDHDADGATYLIYFSIQDDIIPEGSTLWICNVAHDVCGEHPEIIYITNIINGK